MTSRPTEDDGNAHAHLPTDGERVRLRRLDPSDVNPFLAYRSDPAIGLYQSWERLDRAGALAFLSEMRDADIPAQGAWRQIGIAFVKDDRLIGDAGLFLSADGTEAEMGVTLVGEQHGRGLALEAANLITSFLFATTKIDRIIGIADIRNTPSLALMERLGMALEEEYETVFNGEPCVERRYVMLRP